MRRLAFFAVISLCCVLPVQGKTHPGHRRHSSGKKSDSSARSPKTIEEATRLQVFLDRANFAPGRLDGHYGDFTLKALALYRQSRGEQPPPSAKSDSAPDVNGIDLASVEPVFVSYTVTDADLQMVGSVPKGVPEQAKLSIELMAVKIFVVDETINTYFHYLYSQIKHL